MQQLIDILCSPRRVIQDLGSHGDLLEDPQGDVVAIGQDMMQMRPGPVRFAGWPSANHYHRDTFGVGAGGRVDQTECAGSVSHSNGAQTPHAGVAIRRVTRIQLVTGRDVLDIANDHRLKEGQDIVSRDAEQVIDSETLEAAKKKFCDGHQNNNSKLCRGFGSARLPATVIHGGNGRNIQADAAYGVAPPKGSM